MLKITCYIIENAQKNWEPVFYVQSIVVNKQNADIIITDYTQVLLVYEHLDSELQLTLTESIPQITVMKFIE